MAIVPARGGSKGILKKNIRVVAGKPLIAWTLEAAKKSKFINKVIVSSDDENILSISSDFQVDVIKRPSKLATDSTPSEPVIKHVLDSLESANYYDFLILLQPTSPARNDRHIDEAIEVLLSKNATSLISVYEPDHSPLKSFLMNEKGYIQGIVDNEMPFMRRQDLPSTFMSNGAIYIIDRKKFLEVESLYTEDCVPYLMSKSESLDIDTLEDMNKFEKYMSEKTNA